MVTTVRVAPRFCGEARDERERRQPGQSEHSTARRPSPAPRYIVGTPGVQRSAMCGPCVCRRPDFVITARLGFPQVGPAAVSSPLPSQPCAFAASRRARARGQRHRVEPDVAPPRTDANPPHRHLPLSEGAMTLCLSASSPIIFGQRITNLEFFSSDSYREIVYHRSSMSLPASYVSTSLHITIQRDSARRRRFFGPAAITHLVTRHSPFTPFAAGEYRRPSLHEDLRQASASAVVVLSFAALLGFCCCDTHELWATPAGESKPPVLPPRRAGRIVNTKSSPFFCDRGALTTPWPPFHGGRFVRTSQQFAAELPPRSTRRRPHPRGVDVADRFALQHQSEHAAGGAPPPGPRDSA